MAGIVQLFARVVYANVQAVGRVRIERRIVTDADKVIKRYELMRIGEMIADTFELYSKEMRKTKIE